MKHKNHNNITRPRANQKKKRRERVWGCFAKKKEERNFLLGEVVG